MSTANITNQKEVWKTPPSINCPRVEVSNLGRIRTLPFEFHYKHLGKPVKQKRQGRIYKLSKDTRGRWLVCGGAIRKSMICKSFLLHRLVAECFVKNPKPREYNMVFFKDGNIGNCNASNLEWGCRRDRDLMARGNCAIYKIRVFSNGEQVGEYVGCGEVGRALGCTKQLVHYAIKNGTLCKGYELVALKGDGDKPYHSLEEARNADLGKPINKWIQIPEEVYSKKNIPIPLETVFE